MAEAWLRRWLYRLCLAVAVALVGLLVVAPWLGGDEPSGTLTRILALFGHDAVVRRTSFASAAALAVTARIFFFQPAGRLARPPRRPPSDVTGA